MCEAIRVRTRPASRSYGDSHAGLVGIVFDQGETTASPLQDPFKESKGGPGSAEAADHEPVAVVYCSQGMIDGSGFVDHFS